MPSIADHFKIERRAHFAVLHSNEHFVVIRMEHGGYRIVPNAHADDSEAFAAMVVQAEREGCGKLIPKLSEARKTADLASSYVREPRPARRGSR